MATVRKAAKKKVPAADPGGSTLVDLAHQVRSWTDSVLGIAGGAADVTMGAAKMMLPKPGQRERSRRPVPCCAGCARRPA